MSVILLSWNRKDEILKSLRDLREQTFRDFEIVVIDQGSTDGVVDAIKSGFPEVRLIELGKNTGVPGGRNRGAENAKGDILVFLDNDASFEKHALEIVIRKFQQYPGAGILGFKILNIDGTDLDYSSWVYQKSKIGEADSEFETYTYCGAGHAIRRETFEKVGGYWEELFFGWEEMDFSIQALNARFDILYCPEVRVFHRKAEEKRVDTARYNCYRLRNSLWVLWRYIPILQAAPQTFIRMAAYLIKALRGGYFFKMLLCCLTSTKKIGLMFDGSKKVSDDTVRRFYHLSDKGPLRSQIRSLFSKNAKYPGFE